MRAPSNMYDHIDGHELFRRAIVDGDELAWAEGIARYRALLAVWARRRAASGEHDDDIADQAFSRAWVALSPERFEQFPTLSALLAYLRSCVTSAVIDSARSMLTHERLAEAIEIDGVATPEQIALAQCEQQAVWEVVRGVVHSEQERVILVETFVLGQPPRAILAHYPQLFADVVEIYNVKRNLFERLKRCPELRQLYQEQ